MNLSLENARLVEKRSDEVDTVGLTNEIRDLLQQEGRYFREAITTGATPLAVWDMNLSRNTVLWVEVVVSSYNKTTGDGGASWRIARFKNVAGVGTAGVLVQTSDDYDAAGAIALAITGVNLALTVTGVAAQTIGWHARVVVLEAPWVRV